MPKFLAEYKNFFDHSYQNSRSDSKETEKQHGQNFTSFIIQLNSRMKITGVTDAT